jgi:protein ImuB
VELLESLLFVVGAMLEQLVVRAAGRVLALASVMIELSLEGGGVHTRTVRPALPSNDRRLWLKLLHLDLEAHPPAAAIVAITLSAEPGKTSKVQLGLFSPQLPEPGRLDVTLARIRAIVGEECVGQAVLKDTHRPDLFRMERFTVAPVANAQALGNERVAEQAPKAAMRQLRPAERVAVALQRGRPASITFRETRYEVEEAYGPWMACGDWWNAALWDMEQWDVVVRAASPEGDACLLFCCLVHDLRQQCWQMAGLYD